MNRLSSEDLARYCSRLKDFNLSAQDRENAVAALHLIFSTLIGTAFGKSSTQLALEERNLRETFQSAAARDNVLQMREPNDADLASKVANKTPKIAKERHHDI